LGHFLPRCEAIKNLSGKNPMKTCQNFILKTIKEIGVKAKLQ